MDKQFPDPVTMTATERIDYFNNITIDQLFGILNKYKNDPINQFVIINHYDGQIVYCISCIRRLKGKEYEDRDMTENIASWNKKLFKFKAAQKIAFGFHDLAYLEFNK